MRQTKLILAFCVLSLTFVMGRTSIVSPPVTKLTTISPTPQGLPDQFTPLANRGVVNNELDHYQAYNSQTDDFMQLDENPGINFTVSQDTKHANGSYSCRLFYRSYGKSRFQTEFYQVNDTTPAPNIRDNATFSFSWFLESIDNVMEGQDFVRVSVFLDDTVDKYLRYYLGGYAAQDGSSYGVNVTGHNTTSDWVYTWRNLTQDYIDRWGVISQDIGILAIIVEIDQAQYRDVPIVTYLDNMSVIINDANTVDNGDFEILDGIQRPENWGVMNLGQEYNPATIKHVTGMNDAHAVNMSTRVTGDIAGRYFLSYSTLAATWLDNAQNRSANNCSDKRPMRLVLNYKIENTLKTEDGWAVIRFTFNNGSANQEINFYFSNTVFFGNTEFENNSITHTLHILLDNRTNMWLTADVDLWPLLSSLNYGSTSQLIGLQYDVLCYGDSNDTFSILFDNMGLQTSTFTDAQFEHPVQSGKIGGWEGYPGSEFSSLYRNYTETKYSGSFAGNFSMGGQSGQIRGYSYYYYLTYGLVKGLIFEADYNIPHLNGDFWDAITMTITLKSWDGSDPKAIVYGLAYGDIGWVSPANGSSTGNFQVSTFNVTGQWNHLERNLYNDFRLLFQNNSPENFYIAQITLIIQSQFYDKPLCLLLDNTNLKIANDPDPPRITAITLDPSPPKAGTSLKVTAQVIDDGIGVQTVTLMYSTDTGTTWQSKAMASCGSNNYCATIENLAENSILSYYVVAADAFGNTAQSTTSGSSTMVIVLPSFSFWEAFLFGALIAGGAIGVSLVTVKVRQVKKAKTGRVVPAAGLSSATKQP